MASKHDKELWVTGHNGTTMAELSLTSVVTPVSSLLRLLLVSALHAAGLRSSVVDLVLDYELTLLPTVVSFTRPDTTPLVLTAMAAACAGLFLLLRSVTTAGPQQQATAVAVQQSVARPQTQRISVKPAGADGSSNGAADTNAVVVSAEQQQLAALNSGRPRFLAEYRAALMLSTAVAILAVDFVIFPRRFCKTETFGTGLMDTGVGAFLLSHALTSHQARSGRGGHRSGSSSGSDASGSAASASFRRAAGSQLVKIFWSVAPLLLIGSARLFTHKAVDYQEHTSEYGVHWNFFYTLAAVALLSESLGPLIPNHAWAATGIAIICGYQYALSRLGLSAYILEHPRSNLLHANKEGVCSSIGYFALYLVGVELGRFLLRAEPTLARWRRKLGVVVVLDALCWLLALAADAHVQPVSRRMVNLAYVFWTLAFNLLMISVYLAWHLLLLPDSERHPSGIIDALNANQLPAFLLANLCTGAINLGMNTLVAPPRTAYAVVCGYIVFVVTVVRLLYARGCTVQRLRSAAAAAGGKTQPTGGPAAAAAASAAQDATAAAGHDKQS